MVRSAVYYLVIALLTFSSCLNSQNSSLNGHWEGKMTCKGKSVNVYLNISDKGRYFDIPEMGFFQQPFVDVEMLGDKFVLTVDDNSSVVITGTVSGNEIKASVEDDDNISISLKRTSPGPEIYTEEEITYKSNDVMLSGTFIKPKSPAPYAVIIFIHGSGKMTRETMRSRAYLFVKNGYAALIYDRRGRGRSEGSPDKILPMNVLAGDALAGVDYVYTRNDIDKSKIGVYGISQGAWVAPLCASLSDKISFLITVSAPGINPDKQNDYAADNIVSDHLSGILESSKVPGNVINDVVDNLKEYNRNIGKQDTSGELTETFPGFSSFEPAPVWEKVSIPVLAIWGRNDKLVPAGESKNIIESALNTGKNSDHTLLIFDEANHSIRLEDKDSKFAGKWELMAPGSNELMIKWINSRCK